MNAVKTNSMGLLIETLCCGIFDFRISASKQERKSLFNKGPLLFDHSFSASHSTIFSFPCSGERLSPPRRSCFVRRNTVPEFFRTHSTVKSLLFILLLAFCFTAVPAIHAETVQANADNEPFSSLYKKSGLEVISFEGTVRAVSTIPVPGKNDYPDCLYAVFINVDSILSKTPSSGKVACEVILTVPILKDNRLISMNRVLPGDKISCTCTPYRTMPQSIQEIQLSDDIQSFEHDYFYVFTINKIKEFSKNGNKNFAKREITVLPIQTLPRDERAAEMRKERIQSEIKRIEDELKKHGGSFAAWKEEYKPIAEKYQKLVREGWKGWIKDSYFAAGGDQGDESQYNTREYIESLRPYKEYLEKNNIDLIVLRIPSRGDFAARVLCSDEFQENPAWIEHYYECLKNDIEIIDPMPEMWKHRFDYPLFYYYQEKLECHPFEGTFYCAAKACADVLRRRYDYKETNHKLGLSKTSHKAAHKGGDRPFFYNPKGNSKFDPRQKVNYDQVTVDGRPMDALPVDSQSPFLFLSNSFFGFRNFTRDASVPQYAAYQLNVIPDWMFQGGGNTLIRSLVKNSARLGKRKVVIMVGHPRQWNAIPPFPKYISDNANKITLEKKLGFSSPELQFVDNDLYIRSKDNNGSFVFTQNESHSFSVKLNIPSIPGKRICMLRLSTPVTNISVAVSDIKDNHQIDSCSFSSVYNENCDLFIPVENGGRDVKITFSRIWDKKILLNEEIELWYY